MGIFGVAYGTQLRTSIGVGIGTLVLAASIAAGVWLFSDRPPLPLLTPVLVGVVFLLDAWRQTKARTDVDDDGVSVYTGWSTHAVGWSEITDIRSARIGPGVEIDRGMGNQFPLPGITPEDIPRLEQMRAVARDARTGAQEPAEAARAAHPDGG